MSASGPSAYAYEKLLVALDSLATGPGDVRKRLLIAYESFHPLKEAHFPQHLRKDFRWVLDQVTKHGPVYDYKGRLDRGSVEETLRRIKNGTGVKIAAKLLRLYHALDAHVRPHGVLSNLPPQTNGRKRKSSERALRAPAVGRTL